jgi:imidazolonepropionase-like amidohydrolase
MVPTLQTMDKLIAHPDWWGLRPDKVALLEDARTKAWASVKLADSLDVQVASGSDVVGPWQGRRGEELAIKAKLLGAHKAILSATAVNAALFRLEDRIGTVEAGKEADLILVSGEPLDRIDLLADPSCIPLVVKGGRIVKDAEARATAA